MWQVHHQKVDLLFDTANHGECLAKIRLSMARRMRQWHEHLPLTLLGREDIVLHNRDAAFKVMLITQSFKYPFRRVSLLLWNQLICLKGLINNPGKRIQLRASYRLAAPVSGRKRKRQHLGDGAWINSKYPRRFPAAHTVN